ncbi:hypothetical protein U9M48_013982 [Paspalum notatum var. saurae]|uniref:Uncharacterized protein n=1 Tax=Paspalum notatum var. saurae TaxID=547442 RepID=A0AAQ3T0J5_PASNO
MPCSPSREMNQFKTAMHPVSFWTFFYDLEGSIWRMTSIFSGLASIHLLQMTKPSDDISSWGVALHGYCGTFSGANGVVESKNRSLIEMARMMLDKHRTPRKFWPRQSTLCAMCQIVMIEGRTDA